MKILMTLMICCTAAAAVAQSSAPPSKEKTETLGGRPETVENPPDVAYAPLLLYDGTWVLKRDGAKSGEKPDKVDNDCVRTGDFVVCEQQVNDRKPTLDVFVSTGEPGRYWAHPLTAEDKSLGRGDLTIDGDLWTFSSQETDKGKTIWYRTTNLFSDKNEKITFKVEESADGKTWKTNLSGIELLAHH